MTGISICDKTPLGCSLLTIPISGSSVRSQGSCAVAMEGPRCMQDWERLLNGSRLLLPFTAAGITKEPMGFISDEHSLLIFIRQASCEPPKWPSAHGMRNELSFASEVALDGTSRHVLI